MADPKIGLVLGSGAARGWAHVGVLEALSEMGIKPDVITGCSAGALIGGAKLLGVLPELTDWAKELSPLSALKEFNLSFSSAGLIDPNPAFDVFRPADKNIEELDIPLGVTATDLATGEEIWITEGSVIDAVKASSAIPLVFRATSMQGPHGERWLVDGALCNPVPVDLARSLGAEKIIAVDLNARTRTLGRFDRPPSRDIIVKPTTELTPSKIVPQQLSELLQKTRNLVEEHVAMAKAQFNSKPQFIETAIAARDIFEMHLARAKAAVSQPDIVLSPDMRDCPRAAFDRVDEFMYIGYETTMAAREDIEALLER